MITLKLAVYTEEEVKALTTLLANNRRSIQRDTANRCLDCGTCNYRHLCIDLMQAHMYAKDYTPKR